NAEALAQIRRHVENEVPEAITHLGNVYRVGQLGLVKSDKKAAKIYRRAVELGNVDAMTFLGDMYDEGLGVKLDKKKAEELYRTAADRGHAVAQCNLAFVLGSQKKKEEAFRYCALAADQGYTFAENNLGCCYRDGAGTELAQLRRHVENEVPEAITHLGSVYREGLFGLVKSDKKAAKIWKRAVELRDVRAMVFLGSLYEHGSGVKLDKKKAERLYRAAADRGHAVAQFNVGILLFSEEKFEEAFRYYALSADQGYTAGENNLGCSISHLGIAYRCGRYGLVKSDKPAAKIWKRAVELGNVDAMRHLGAMYEHGSGVKLDKKKAERLYRAAADRGHAVAQCNLGIFLDSEKKFEEAVRYFALAADQGYTDAEQNLGCCYMGGEGTEVDLGKARYWFERAAAKGHEKAIQALARLDARTGSGVKLDKKKAERLFRMAADRGDAGAQSNLGILLASEEKFEETFRYFALAADQGWTNAENNLGICYRDGDGTEKAAKIYRRAVELGNVDAMLKLGFLYENGSGVKLDKKKAERLYRMGADRGDAVAQNNVAFLLVSEKKFEEAFRYFVLAADQGLTSAENNLGMCYRRGEGTEKKFEEAFRYYALAADQGYTDAEHSLGYAYRRGLYGLVESDKKAAKIYRRAVELGNVDAMNNLGLFYNNGFGVKLDKKKAERLFRTAADRGDAAAQTSLGFLLDTEEKHEEAFRCYVLAADQGYTTGELNLGICYEQGEGTEVDLGKARYWFEPAKIWKRAVELGSVEAMVFLGELYEHGNGVKLDKKKAERLWRMAADRGNATAQCNLGVLLHSEEKFEESLRYYALSADQGYTPGEINLGGCYSDGQGTEVDLGKARYLFERAAAKGHELATRNLARLDARA
ncbi:hypothetical protein AURANDRAFT_29118, partial [Aureococcus anophagefferens]